jgi:hypothetical protein
VWLVTNRARTTSSPSTGEELIGYVASTILSVVGIVVIVVSFVASVLAIIATVKLPWEAWAEYRDWLRSLRP